MNVLITGAASGLGNATALLFAQKGCNVYACDIEPVSDDCFTRRFFMDVTDDGSIRSVSRWLEEHQVKLDRILHFAGMHVMASVLEIDEERLMRIMQVNLLGPMRVNRALFPLLSPDARIIITTSEVAPLDPMPFNGLYNITKTALDCYAQALRQEAGILGVTVITIRPGAFNTPLERGSIPAMHRMSGESKYFSGQAERFQRIMELFTGRPGKPSRLARYVWRAASSRHPCLIYSVNANPLLRLMSALPKRMQVWIVGLLVGRSRGRRKDGT